MGAIDQTLGSLLVGSFFNNILYALEALAVIHFFRHPRREDRLLLKVAIVLAFLSDTLCTIGACASVYLYTVTHWGDADYIQRQYWPLSVVAASTGVTAFLVQSFLISRYFGISRNWIITAILGILILACFGGTIGTAVLVIVFDDVSARHKYKIIVTIWLSTSAASDIGIALALIWQLTRMKSAFPSASGTIQRLILGAIQTGTVTSAFAMASLIAFLSNQQSNVAVAFAFCIGRVYALTMLYNLNFRDSMRRHSAQDSSTADPHASTPMEGVYITQYTTFHSTLNTSQRSSDHTKENDTIRNSLHSSSS